MTKLARIFRDRRESLGWTQEETAKAAGLDGGYVSRIERGQRHVEIGKGLALAGALGISLEEIANAVRRKGRR